MTTTQTANYSLVKPVAGSGESVSVQAHLDDNWDKIDQDMNRFDRQVFSTAGAGQTWNKPARAKRVVVRVQGAGGSGGGAGAAAGGNGSSPGGGGAGGYSEKLFLASTLAASETVDVGAGGTGATAGANNGNAGGNSVFATGKAYAVTGNGGAAGSLGAAAGAYVRNAAGAGGAATGGDINIPGGPGGIGFGAGGNPAPYARGGDSKLGAGGQMTTADGTGVAPTGYGSGSAGAVVYAGAGGAQASLAGAQGLVVVDTYY